MPTAKRKTKRPSVQPRRSFLNFTELRTRLVAIAAVAVIGGYYTLNSFAATIPTPSVTTPDTRASLAVAQLHSWFNANTYNTTGWWQSANAVGATIDYMQATGSRTYLPDVQSFYNAHSSKNFIVNSYYDDEGWWALTWIKAYKLTGNTAYLNTAKAIFTNMSGGWDSTCGGGLWWTSAKTYKNSIPNELFLNIATQLHQLTPNDTAYLNWANKEWTWFQGSGLITSSNLVVDGLSSTCQPLTNPANTWTYNQGVILGGLVNLSNITGDPTLLTTAQNIATAVMTSSALSPKGILTEPCEPKKTCSSDNAVFKGIFMQNLNVLYQQTKNQSDETYIQQNANAMWSSDRSNTEFGLAWAGPFDSADAARQTSALDLLNTLTAPTSTILPATAQTVYSGMKGLCMDNYQGSSAKNNKVELFTCNGNSGSQQWKFATNGTIQIAGQCVDLYQANTNNGGKVDMYPCNGGTTQQWQLLSNGTIYNVKAGKCLDDPAFATATGTQLDIYTCNGGTNQVWYTPS